MKRIIVVSLASVNKAQAAGAKVRSMLATRGIPAEILYLRPAEVQPGTTGDVILSIGAFTLNTTVPVVDGMPLLTSIGEDKMLHCLEKILSTTLSVGGDNR